MKNVLVMRGCLGISRYIVMTGGGLAKNVFY